MSGDRRQQRSALRAIEEHMQQTDPAFHRWATQGEDMLPRRRRGPRLTVTLLFFVAAIALLVGGLHAVNLLLVATGALVLLLSLVLVLVGAVRPTAYPRRSFWRRGMTSGRLTAQFLEGQAAAPVPHTPGSVVTVSDGGPATGAALRYAAAEARRRDVVLTVLTTYFEPIDPDLDDFDAPRRVLAARARAAAASALARELGPLPPHEIVVAAGPAARVLRRWFMDAALVVLVAPSRRHSGILHRPSDATQYLLSAPAVPVVVVPPAHAAA